MKYRITLSILILVLSLTMANGQTVKQDSINKKHFIGSSFFVLANFFPEPPSYYQINYGYRLNSKNVISVEAITWTYNAPLGIPYGSSFENPDEDFPGSVRAYGIGVAYKHVLWKDFYSAVHATPLLQNYLDADNEKIQSGFQLFCVLRFGYHFKIFKNRFFIEPSVAFTSWPINTNLPESFLKVENKWPKYFLFEPGLHFGINF